MSADSISGSFVTELFGKGTGSSALATSTQNGAGKQNPLPNAAAAGGYSDAGTLLVERGWIGLVLAVLVGAALIFVSIRIARTVPPGRWASAFTLSVPSAVILMGIYALICTTLQNHASAITFWVVVALGLSPGAAFGIGRLRTKSRPG